MTAAGSASRGHRADQLGAAGLVRAVLALFVEVAADAADDLLPVGAGVGWAADLVGAALAVGLAVAHVLLRDRAAAGAGDEAGAVELVGAVFAVLPAVADPGLGDHLAAVGAGELDAADLVVLAVAVGLAVADPVVGDGAAVGARVGPPAALGIADAVHVAGLERGARHDITGAAEQVGQLGAAGLDGTLEVTGELGIDVGPVDHRQLAVAEQAARVELADQGPSRVPSPAPAVAAEHQAEPEAEQAHHRTGRDAHGRDSTRVAPHAGSPLG